MTRFAHRQVSLFRDDQHIDTGSAVRIATYFYDPTDPSQHGEYSRLVQRLSEGKKTSLEKDGGAYNIFIIPLKETSVIIKYETAKRIYKRCNKESLRKAREAKKFTRNTPEWMEVKIESIMAEAGAKAAKEWMQKFEAGDMTENHKNKAKDEK